MCSFLIVVGSHLFFSEICLTHETTHEILDCAKKWNGYDSIASTESSIYRQIGDNVLQKINGLKHQTTVNRPVVGSSPTGGAKNPNAKAFGFFLFYFFILHFLL